MPEDTVIYVNPERVSLINARELRLEEINRELLDALKGLFDTCAMIHKGWGEIDNTEEADKAIKAARAAIAKAEGM